MNNGNPEALNHFIDLQSLLDKIREKSEAAKDPGFKEGFFSSGMSKFGDQILANIQGGSYRLMREYDRGGTKHLFFRMFGKGGLNYQDYSLIRVKDSIRASDIYAYTSDENVSSSMAILVNVASAANKDSRDIPEDLAIMTKLIQYKKKGDNAAAKETYDKLDTRYKENKAIQVIYIDICKQIDVGLYKAALEHFSVSFPGMPSCYLMMVDMYTLSKEYEKGLAVIDILDSLAGKDPFLDYYRGNFFRLLNKESQSLACYERVYAYDPGIFYNDYKLILAYARAKEYVKAKAVIELYRKSPQFKQGYIDQIYEKHPELK
jgi:hypothetical protein